MKKFLIYIFLLTSSIVLANKPRRVGLTFRVWECQNIPAVYDEWGTLVKIGYAHWTGRIVDDVKTVNFPGESCEGSAANIINTYGGITYQGINDAAASLHTMYTASNPVTGETVYYTDDGLTQAEITQILTDGGYTVHSEWFASPEAGLFPCPAPVKDLPVVTPLAEDLPVIDPIDYFCFTPQISLGIFDSKKSG